MIGTIARLLGIDTLLVYLLIAALAGGGFWAWSEHKYNAGYTAGELHERQAWIDQREEDEAKRLAKAAADQRKIDQIEADYLALQGQLAETQTALEEAIKSDGADQKPAIPKSVSRALNQVGR